MGAPEGREYEKQHALDFFQEYGVYGNRADGHTMQFNGPIAGNVVLSPPLPSRKLGPGDHQNGDRHSDSNTTDYVEDADSATALEFAVTIFQFAECAKLFLSGLQDNRGIVSGIGSQEELQLKSQAVAMIELKTLALPRDLKNEEFQPLWQTFVRLCVECTSAKEQLRALSEKTEGYISNAEEKGIQHNLVKVQNDYSLPIKGGDDSLRGEFASLALRIEHLREQVLATFLIFSWHFAGEENEEFYRSLERQMHAPKKAVTEGQIQHLYTELFKILRKRTPLNSEQSLITIKPGDMRSVLNALYRFSDDALSSAPLPHGVETLTTERILHSLEYSTLFDRKQSIKKAYEKTFEWMFQDESDFVKWLENKDRTVYWITGKPGSGKSTLMKYISQHNSLRKHLNSWTGSHQLLISGFYFWHAGANLDNSLEGLLKTILYECIREFTPIVSKVFPGHCALLSMCRSEQILNWTLEDLDKAFRRLASMSGKYFKLVLLIDGLDEFKGNHVELAELVSNITREYDLKVCVSSRPWNAFVDAFGRNPSLKMEDLTRSNIDHFIESRFESSSAFIEQRKAFPGQARELLNNIAEKALGVFLWVTIVVDTLLSDLSDGASFTTLLKRLHDIPHDISKLYGKIWEDIGSRHRADTSRILQILKACLGTLQVRMLWLALEGVHNESVSRLKDNDSLMETMKRRLSSSTRCLLEVRDNGTVDFLHRTAHDWICEKQNWERICSNGPSTFNPYICLLEAQVHLFLAKDYGIGAAALDSFYHCLHYASYAEEKYVENEHRVLESLEKLEKHCLASNGGYSPFRLYAATFAIGPYFKNLLKGNLDGHLVFGEKGEYLEEILRYCCQLDTLVEFYLYEIKGTKYLFSRRRLELIQLILKSAPPLSSGTKQRFIQETEKRMYWDYKTEIEVQCKYWKDIKDVFTHCIEEIESPSTHHTRSLVEENESPSTHHLKQNSKKRIPKNMAWFRFKQFLEKYILGRRPSD